MSYEAAAQPPVDAGGFGGSESCNSPNLHVGIKISRSLMLVSDLDDTMVGTSQDCDRATTAFRDFWGRAKASGVPCTLVYNTGRSLPLYEALWKQKQHCMAVPDVFIGGVGTRIYMPQQGQWVEDAGWRRILEEGWSLPAAQATIAAAVQRFGKDNVRVADPTECHEHKLTLLFNEALYSPMTQLFQEQMKEHGLDATIIEGPAGAEPTEAVVQWRFIDLVPKNAGKGKAMSYVQQQLAFDDWSTVACGDSPNDLLMLAQARLGIVVSNCTPCVRKWASKRAGELDGQLQQRGVSQPERRLFLAKHPRAAGIMEGLAAFGFVA